MKLYQKGRRIIISWVIDFFSKEKELKNYLECSMDTPKSPVNDTNKEMKMFQMFLWRKKKRMLTTSKHINFCVMIARRPVCRRKSISMYTKFYGRHVYSMRIMQLYAFKWTRLCWSLAFDIDVKSKSSELLKSILTEALVLINEIH